MITGKDKTPVGFNGFIRDITQRIKAERQRAKLKNQRLQRQKMAAIANLAGGIAHGLNNILSGIVSYPDLLLMKLSPTSPLRKQVEIIKKCGENAASFVQELLTLSGKGLSSQQVININNFINEYLDSLEHKTQLIYHPLVEVRTALAPNLPDIFASREHLYEIIKNLISNAADAMPDGGMINITTQYCPGRTQERPDLVKPINDFIQLQVMDEGPGLSTQEKERIFEPFYIKNVMGRSGSGLGMAAVWGAVRDLNGVIDILNGPEKGTTFRILFPAATESATNRTSSSKKYSDADEKPKGSGEKILVVDDLQSQREIVSNMLKILGYNVDTAASGEAAVRYVEKHPVGLLILDMKMEPGIDGLDTYKQIIEINPTQKAIICSGFSTSDRIRETQSLGAGECLIKPFLMGDLARAVRSELNR